MSFVNGLTSEQTLNIMYLIFSIILIGMIWEFCLVIKSLKEEKRETDFWKSLPKEEQERIERENARRVN